MSRCVEGCQSIPAVLAEWRQGDGPLRGQVRNDFVKSVELVTGKRRIRVVSVGQMSHETLTHESVGKHGCLQESGHVPSLESQSSHAGVHLDVNGVGGIFLHNFPAQRLHGVGIGEYGNQVGLNEIFRLAPAGYRPSR